jgi:hypothetical protein
MSTTPHLLLISSFHVSDWLSFISSYVHTISALLHSLQCLPLYIFFWSLHSMSLTGSPSSHLMFTPSQPCYIPCNVYHHPTSSSDTFITHLVRQRNPRSITKWQIRCTQIFLSANSSCFKPHETTNPRMAAMLTSHKIPACINNSIFMSFSCMRIGTRPTSNSTEYDIHTF